MSFNCTAYIEAINTKLVTDKVINISVALTISDITTAYLAIAMPFYHKESLPVQ